MNKLKLFFQITLIASGLIALIIRVTASFIVTAYLQDFTAFLLFMTISFPLYGFFAAASLALGVFTLKKDNGSAVFAQILYLACLYVALSVFFNISTYINLISENLVSTNPQVVAIQLPFLYNYGKGVSDIAFGDFSNYMFAFAQTISIILGVIAVIQLLHNFTKKATAVYTNPRYTRKDITVPLGYHSHYTNKAQRPYTNAKNQRDIFDTSNDFFSKHTEDDIF